MTKPTELRLLTAALELVAEHGLAGVSMSAIATAAEVSRQTLYNHFPDVEAIVYAATALHHEQSLAELTSMLDTIASPTDRLEHLVRHTAAMASGGHPSVGGDGFSAETRAVIKEHNQSMQSLVADALDLGVEKDQFRPDLDIKADSLLILRLIEACGELVSSTPTAAAELVATTVRTVLASVERRPG